jgi:starch synthase (maltosyl-transferring)
MFFEARNDNVILYGKRDPMDNSIILVAINLDPHNVQTAVIEVPLWMFGLRDDERIGVTDLWRDFSFVWFGKWQQITLDPNDFPFAIWRLERPL